MGDFFGVEPYPLKEAVLGEDYSLAKQLVEDGHDPFKSGGMIESSTAFHEAVKKGNLELLPNMAAAPGTTWTDRFFVTRNQLISVPTSRVPAQK
jgi:hypothetical protein